MGNIHETDREVENNLPVPYVVYRDAISDNRWVVKKLVWALIVSIILIFASNIAWLIVWNSYDFSGGSIETSVDSEGDGIANYTGGNGGVIVGESGSSENLLVGEETRQLEGERNP